ncbi:hypothetical protein KBD45_04200 [Candidatus Dojkabacteria bacterium]|nr:hypothetical protein [Candidatus Dojkabacteria bacterium]
MTNFKIFFSRINKFIIYSVLITTVIFLISGFIRVQLPFPEEILPINYNEPLQTNLDESQKPFPVSTSDGNNYLITPLFNYEINALVVSGHDTQSTLDIVHKMWDDSLNIKDLCMIFGETLKTDIYKKIKFSNGSYSCSFEGSPEYFSKFNIYDVTNNHLLTNNPEIASKIRQIKVGDQVKLQGILASYTNTEKAGCSRGSSTTRLDTGDGACETIYLTNVEILKENLPQVSNIYNISQSLLLAEAVLLIFSLISNAYFATK